MRARLSDSVSGRNRSAENILLTKHVVAAGRFAKDPGSTPGASSLCSQRQRERRLPRRSLLLRRRRASEHSDGRFELRLGKPLGSVMDFTYVYILQSEAEPERYHTGLTDDLK